MKKFAFGILSVFMILGGLLLSACTNEVSLSVSTQEVVIYTNDDQKENFKQKEIEVVLENSSAGIGVEVSSGTNCIEIEKTYTQTPKTNGKYAFKILTKENEQSGKAEVKVYSIEDKSKEKTINVSVMTVLENLVSMNEVRSNMFVIKGQEKELVAEDYFEFNPISANVKDVDWNFEASQNKQFMLDGEIVAEIFDNTLIVYPEYPLNSEDENLITLIASFKENSKVSNTVTFDVLSDSTIKNLTIDGSGIIENSVTRIEGENFKLKRNNSSEAVAQGSIEINTTYDINLSVDAYQILNGEKYYLLSNGGTYYLTQDEISENFSVFNFDIVEEKVLNSAHTYKFNIDAYDLYDSGLYGKFYLVFNVNYADYYYSVTTKDITISIDTSYTATRIDLYDEANRSIDSSVAVNVFSSYNAGQGFAVKAVVQPENRKIDNNAYRFVVDTNQSAFSSVSLNPSNPIDDVFKVYYKGKYLTFSKDGSMYVSNELISGDEAYFVAVDTFKNVEVDVQSLSNTNVYSTIVLNLFKISDDTNLLVTNADDSEIEKNVYISSSLTSSKTKIFEYKIKGISSDSGLSLETVASDNFEFSNFEVVRTSDVDDDKYIVVRFSVNLLTSKFDEKAKFTFVHLTGKTSETVTISAFVPIESVYIQNLDAASADVFKQSSMNMGYELSEEEIVSSSFTNNTLSKLVLEASTTIKLKTETSGASLAEDKIKFKYLSFEDVQNVVESMGLAIDIEKVFDDCDFDVIARAYNYFKNASEFSSFVITSDKLVVNDNSFKGVISAEIYGYNEQHEQTVLVRFFTVESVYSVRYLAPNVRTKLLYTTETLSEKDMNLSYVDVVLSLRPDSKVPSYSNEIERLGFSSAGLELEKVNESYYRTAYYTITNIGFVESGRKIRFRITANSTNLLTVFNDVISVTYKDINNVDDQTSDETHDITRKAEISIEIRNVKRIENVEWMNKPLDGKIYLNLTAATNSEKEFTISTSVLPADANDIKLTHKYFASSGSASDLNFAVSEAGQTVNVNINTSVGGTGYLYLLPSDMIKNVDGVDSLLLYKYFEEDGKITEVPYYGVKLNDLNNFYSRIIDGVEENGDEVVEFDNYFYNNDGVKIYYKDIILKIEVVIADGRSQSTRIRLYNQGDLENIDYSLFYEIMNDISFYGWETITEFKGSIDGNGHTFKFVKSENSSGVNHTFINILSTAVMSEGSGTIENLNFVGFVSSTSSSTAGFIANQVSGGAVIKNCTIDVYSDSNSYMPSELKSSASNYTGGAVGQNRGTLSNVKVYGLSIKGENGNLPSAQIGGLVGWNFGTIENCGYELYSFGNEVKTTVANAGKNFGGLIGYAENPSRIKYSYVYDFGGSYDAENAKAFAYTINTASKVVSFEQCFAYLGEVNSLYDNENSVSIKNSYTTVKNYDEELSEYSYTSAYFGANGEVISTFEDEDVWFVEGADGFDASVNFGHTYLRNVLPSATVDLDELNVADYQDENGNKKCSYVEDAATSKRGVLYIYNPIQTITNVAEKSELDAYNTISISSLFNVTEFQAKSLLLTSNSTNVMISANQIRVVNSTFAEFDIVVHLKTNFAQTQTFKFVVVNAIPKLTTTLNSLEVKEGQTIMLQNGKTKNVVYNFDSKIALNGNLYALKKDSYDIRYNVLAEDEDYVNVSKTGNVLVLSGKDKKDEISVDTQVVVLGLDEAYQESTMIERTLDVCVFNGTTALSVANADGIVVKSSKYANFEVYMTSDDFEIVDENKTLLDNLYLTLKNGEVEVESEKTQDNRIVFNVDDKLVLEAFWSYTNIDEKLFKFDVVIKICDENKHLVDHNYEDLVLFVNAESQKDNDEYVRQINFVVEVQEIESTSIAFYEVAMRQYKDSKIYYTKSSNTLTTVSPSSDMILAVTVSPAYAQADSFNLTYSMSGEGTYGTVSVAKLDPSVYGFYVSPNYTTIENGVKVDITDADKTGDGVYYFRVYISSLFSGEVDLKFNLEVFGENNINNSKSITVNALNEAKVKVDGYTRTILAKGNEAEVEVTVGANQSIYNLYLENCGSGISLLFDKNQEPVYSGSNKTYKATLYAGFDSVLSSESKSGVFYVCATVERTLNGIQEFKTTYATVYLVDFALDLDETKVSNTRKTASYNGKTYDVLTSYLNDSQILSFDYTLLPENYTYDKTNEEEIAAVNEIEQKKIAFKNANYYADAESGYYINYVYNANRGTYEVVKLRSQLWYATNESYVTGAYNEVSGRFNGGNGYFSLEEDSNGNIIITGKRTGLQLMMLRTTVVCQGEEFVRDYFFLIQVEVYTDEDSPRTIRSAEEFLNVVNEGEAADYILMNDIVLENYEPIDSDNFRSLDGNGYTIHLNSFAVPEDASQLDLALFKTVASTSTLKNLQVNVYNGGQIVVDISMYNKINIAGFAISNKGIIYNCSVVSYYDEEYQTSRINGKTGIVVSYVKGAGTDAIEITSLMGIESNVAGFVVNNEEASSDEYSSISNCRVGGTETYHALVDGGIAYRQTLQLSTFYIISQGTVSGFVVENDGEISASYAKNIQIENDMQSTSSITAGFVVDNNMNVKNSFTEGLGGSFDAETGDPLPYNDKTSIKAMGIVAGFVYNNNGTVLNSYSNIKIEKSYLAAGFVYKNTSDGEISLCYSASLVDEESVGQMKFCGVNAYAISQNEGNISLSYYYKKSRFSDDDSLSGEPDGVYGVNEVFDISTFYGFSFNSSESSYDGIWEMRYEGITLVSANIIAFSNRYSRIVGEVETVFYNKNVRDYETYEVLDVSYGSINNPIIIRNAEDFAKATGKATTTEVSSYKEYYTNTEVLGTYRLVKDIDMSQVAQNSDDTNSVRLRTTTKTFKGILDGNGFTISNISLGSSVAVENYGLFAKLSNAVVMNVDFTVESVHNTEANIVGALAGTAYNTRILSVKLSPTDSKQQSEGVNTAVQGNNIVGGVVGIVLGDSYICNIQVENMDVESAYYNRTKNTETNKEYAKHLRKALNIDTTNSLMNDVSHLSYAGAVIGFVDIYYGDADDYSKFSESLTVQDYNVLSVDVSGTINIYGEVVGGIFGYVGSSTYIYDIELKLSSEPSHIISKNLFAGGIVGESYGGMYAVSSSLNNDTESEIERNEYNYYNGSYTNRGQETIFSYAQNEEGSFEKINSPLFIGGIAGYMGGGYIYVGYSKLNVISTSESTLAAGGIVGLLGKTENYYSLDFLTISASTNYLFRDVYASGDVYAKGGCAGGIIGSLEKNTTGCDVALKNVMALNYFSSDETKHEKDGDYSTKVYTLIGKLYVRNSSTPLQNPEIYYPGNIYLINNESIIQYNVGTGEKKVDTGTPTVGGYESLTNTKGLNIKLNYFGFLSESSNQRASGNLLGANPVGGAEFGGAFESYSYARNYSYFIGNGWAEKFWRHEQDTFLPYIELTPRLDVVFWDIYNTDEVIRSINDSSLTVVVRGRITASINDLNCSDIDLTKDSALYKSLKADTRDILENGLKFRGKIYSYEKYMNTSEGGTITVETKHDGKTVGGTAGLDSAGLIIDKSLFDTVSSSALIDGVKFYVDTNKEFTGVINTIEDSIVRSVKVIYRKKANLSAEVKGTSSHRQSAAGVLAQSAINTNIMNINLLFDGEKDAKGSNVNFVASKTENADKEYYYGLVVGYFEQSSKFTNVSLQNVLINDAQNVTLVGDGVNNNGKVFFGLYTGYTVKLSTAKIEIVMLENVSNINMICEGIKAGEVYIGGYVGKAKDISSITFQAVEGGDGSCDYTFAYRANDNENNCSITNLYQGALVGEIEGGTYSIIGNSMKIKSTNEEFDGITKVSVGGLVGSLNSATVTITSFIVENNIRKIDNQAAMTQVETSDDAVIGGVVGNVNGGKLGISNCPLISGDIYVKNDKTIYAGCVAGKVEGNATLEISGNVVNKTNFVVDATNVYVGGVCGKIDGSVICEENSSSAYCRYYGNITLQATNIYVGGFAGDVSVANETEEVTPKGVIKNFVAGGEIVCNEANANTSIYVGGVVGNFAGKNNTSDLISECFVFEDVYVNYKNDAPSDKLKAYFFGGIVGNAEKVKIAECKSLTSNFNTRNFYEEDLKYTCGAICGNCESNDVVFDTNYYCSGVNYAYEEDSSKNYDCAYLKDTNCQYLGYNSSGDVTAVSKQQKGILSFVSKYVEQENIYKSSGRKLNPNLLTESSHGIAEGEWHALTESFSTTSLWTEILGQDTRVIGNGFVVTRESSQSTANGGLFGTINGGSVSNLLVSINVTEESSDVMYGGITGTLEGSGIIYAVGVNGLISVGIGNDSKKLTNVGGLVGSANGGLISDSYFDGELEYRGKMGTDNSTYGSACGLVGVLSGGFNTVSASYSSGMIVTYLNCHAERFAVVSDNVLGDFIDCYSIMRLDNDSNVEDTPSVTLDSFYGTANVSEVNISVTPITYVGDSSAKRSMTSNATQENDHFKWFYNKFVNYGYATHGFGFLRNGEIKVFTGTQVVDEDYKVEGVNEYYKYNYTKIELQNLKESDKTTYYYEIPNFDKFEQIDTSLKFILRYDINIQSSSKTNLSTTGNFAFDGRNFALQNYGQTSASKGLFNTIESEAAVRNLRLTNAKVENTSNDTIGVLANTNKGAIYNVYVEGYIKNNASGVSTTVGGLAGANSGKIFLAEICVNIENTSSPSVTGGVVGQNGTSDGSGTISYASSNGTIVNSGSSTTSSIEGLAIDGQNIHISQGGIVGWMSSGSVEYAYNTNSVLGNYTNTTQTGVNSVSGGIVGYMSAGTIANCANVGLVGSGNYNDGTAYSYAGGIVGYAASGSVSGCVNDGAVQALGKVVASSQVLSVTRLSGSDDQSLTNSPNMLKFNVSSKYSSVRQVYAFGIGYNATVSGCSTSSDNIKNDGNIVTETQTGYITFDRAAILDNDPDNKVFYGAFSLKQTAESGKYDYHISGVDSYGFTTRIYMVDQITRQYGTTSSSTTNDVKTSTEWGDIGYSGVFPEYSGLVYSYDGSGLDKITELKVDDGDNPRKSTHAYANIDDKTDVLYGVGNDVQYTSSVSFNDYSYYLRDTNSNSLNGCGISNNESAANDKISNIVEKFENEETARNITVGDENLVVVNNYEQLKGALGPHQAIVSQTFDLPANATDIVYSIKHNGQEDWVSKSTTVEVNTVTFTLLYAENSDSNKIDSGYEISASYKIKATTKKISLNNTTSTGEIILDNITEEMCEALEEQGKIGAKKYNSYEGYINGNLIPGEISWDEEAHKAKFTVSSENLATFTNAIGNSTIEGNVDFVLKVEVITEDWEIIDIKYSTSSPSSPQNTTINFADLCSYEDTKGYKTIGANTYASNSEIYNSSTMTLSLNKLLEKLGTPAQIEMGSSSHGRFITYDNGIWSKDGSWSSGTGTISGNTVTLDSEDNFGEWTINYSESMTGDLNEKIGDEFSYEGDSSDGLYKIYIKGTIDSVQTPVEMGTNRSEQFGILGFKKYRYKYTLENDCEIKVTFNGKTSNDGNTYGYTFSYGRKVRQGTISKNGEIVNVEHEWISEGTITLVTTTTDPTSSGRVTVKPSSRHNFSVYTQTTDSSKVDGKEYYKKENGVFVKVENVSSTSGLYEISKTISVESGSEEISVTGFGGEQNYTKTTISSISISGGTNNTSSTSFYLYNNGFRKIENSTTMYLTNDDASIIWEHSAEFEQTNDETIVEGKTYYTKVGDDYTAVENPTGNPSTQSWYEVVEKWETVPSGDYGTLFSFAAIAKLYNNNGDDYIAFIKNNFTENLYYNSGVKATEKQSFEEIKTAIYYKNDESYTISDARVKENEVSITKMLKKSSDSIVSGSKKYYVVNNTNLTYSVVENPTGSPKDQGWFEENSISIGNYVEYSYDEDENGSYINGKFTAKKNLISVYEYSANCVDTKTNISAEQVISNGDAIKVSYVIVGSQIYGESIGLGDVKFIGREHMYKLLAGTDSVFTSNAGAIKNLSVVGVISGRNLITNTSLLVKTNNGTINSTKVFGSIRNVKYNVTGLTINPVAATTENITLTSSNITVTVLDAVGIDSEKNGCSVTTAIVDEFTTKNILISGDGFDGDNGADGENPGDAGEKGGTGGYGGTISTSNGSITVSQRKVLYVRAGTNGKGGYGGNGANGCFDDENSDSTKIIVGGNGGSAGKASITYVQRGRQTNSRSVTYTTYSGNKGIDGFGRIYYNDNRNMYYYLDGSTTRNYSWFTSSGSYHMIGMIGDPNYWTDTAKKDYLYSNWEWHWSWKYPRWGWIWWQNGYRYNEDKLIKDFQDAYSSSGVKSGTKVYYIKKERVDYYNCWREVSSIIVGDYKAINSAANYVGSVSNAGYASE